jgi:hypothetical protein
MRASWCTENARTEKSSSLHDLRVAQFKAALPGLQSAWHIQPWVGNCSKQVKRKDIRRREVGFRLQPVRRSLDGARANSGEKRAALAPDCGSLDPG